VAEPGPSAGDRDGEVEGGPGLAGLLLGGEHAVGVGRPQALDEPAGFAGGGNPGRDLPEELTASSLAGSAGRRARLVGRRLTTAYVPAALLPGWVRAAAAVNPYSHVVDADRAAMAAVAVVVALTQMAAARRFAGLVHRD
jgi:hypothetical protein